MTIAAAAALLLFAGLGRWQWQRGVDKEALWEQFARGDAPALTAAPAELPRLPRYARVRLYGRYDGSRQFLLENRSYQGRPGYEVLTVLQLGDGSGMLVNRGWLPFDGRRDRLPDVALPASIADVEQRVSGRLERLPSPGLERGRAAPPLAGPWPRVTSFPKIEDLQRAYGARLYDGMLLLDPAEPAGFLRDWRPPGLEPARHFSYAIQWWGLGVAVIVLYVGLNLRRRGVTP
ncbi:MAG: SURF1 family protein [Steroidobacteraceae bacterium]|nr:SURF1 family protein [Steroidobacteraceae bacterium]MDW8259962.1 SURF1 family protein [Gammaproteobacteria bacterium]